MRRFFLVAAVTGLWVVGVAAAASASEELDTYLEQADSAGYSGTQFVFTVWDDETATGVYQVEQAGEMVMVHQGTGDSLISSGKVRALDGQAGLAIASWTEAVPSSRYRVGAPEQTVRFDRSAQAIEVFEGDLVRAKLILDAKTGAPLATEVYDGEGELFRFATMLDFDTDMAAVAELAKEGSDYDVVLSAGRTTLPSSLAGYTRIDVYDAPGDGEHAFYADGLFSFSVFVLPADAGEGRFEDASTVELGGESYRRLLAPTDVWVMWRTPDATYVLVGNVPPDHLEDVLSALPRPEKTSFFSRLWRGLFG
jgi:hypothetical protein